MAFPLSSQIFTSGNAAAFSNTVTAGQLAGDGGKIGNVTGANVVGTVAAATLAATANVSNSVAGANVVGNVGSAILAGTVTTNAQPNITSVGTLTSLSVTGNVTGGNIISGGVFQAATITSSSISIPYNTTFPFTANVITLNGNSLWRSNSNIAANTPFAVGNTANTWSMVQQWTKTSQSWYVDPISGLDTNDGSAVSPLRTITAGLAYLGGAGRTLILYPGTYTENVTITNPNINIVGISLGSGVLLSGNVTLNLTGSPSSSQRFNLMRIANLTVTGSGGGYYFNTCQIDALTHNSAGGYVEFTDTDAENGLVTVTAAAQLAVFQGNLRRLTVANASALVTTQDVTYSSANVIVTAGTVLLNNCLLTPPTNTSNVITSSAGTAVYVNYTMMTQTTGAPARVSIGGFVSFTGSLVDIGNSAMGTNLNTVQVTDSLNVLNLANVAALSSRSTIVATGNITTAVGNVSGGNIITAGRVVATGNVSGNFFIGNGSQLANITGANVTGEVAVANTVSNPSQPNITALGVITALSATSISANTLQTSGNAQIGGNLNVAGNINAVGNINIISGNSGQFFGANATGFGALYAGIPSGYTLLAQEVMQYATDFNGYTQVSMTNINSGAQATGDFVITANNGNDATNFIDLGVAGSGYNGTLANNSLGTSVFANDGYLYTKGNVVGGNLILGSGQANGVVRIIANGASNIGDVVATFAAGGLTVANTVLAAQIGNAATFLYGNGANITGLPAGYTNANVTTLLSGNTVTSNIITTGNVAGTFFLGDGSLLANLPVQTGTYGNANVELLLAAASISSNIVTTGNVSGSFILGDGSQLTNLPVQPGTYSDANVFTYLGSNSNLVITTTGNVTAANLTTTRVVPRVGTVVSGATITPTGDSSDQYTVTALAEPATIAAPSGTPVDGQKLTIRIIDNGTAQALTWNSIYQVIGTTLPTTTVISKYVYVGCIYNAQSSKWDVVSVAQEA